MKRLSFLFPVLIFFVLFTTFCRAQNGVVTIYAGPGHVGVFGDGGPADSALLQDPIGIAFDRLGNLYIADDIQFVIRKVDKSGVISTFAGNGLSGYIGDGGPATAAQITPQGIATDAVDNIYIADFANSVIRKIDTLGIITTVAGNGISGYSGDGGAATAAKLSGPQSVAVDATGNIYISEMYSATVRKVGTSGIITTIAGNGTSGFSGDGGPAVSAKLSAPVGIAFDAVGNIYIADRGNNRIRKINTSGIISTIAGTGVAGYIGDGGSAIFAEFNVPAILAINAAGDIFVGDISNHRIRKINTAGIITTVLGNGLTGCAGFNGPAVNAIGTANSIAFDNAQNMYYADPSSCFLVCKIASIPDIVSDSFSVYINKECGGFYFSAVAHSSSSLNLKAFYGDGSSDSHPLTATITGVESVSLEHTYQTSGVYSIKLILLDGSTAIDSAVCSYNYLLCNTLACQFYNDVNGNCMKDSSELSNYFPMSIEVDSNSVAVDTISATSGFAYTAYGNSGDIYTFKILSGTPGLYVACPSGGTITDTLQYEMFNFTTKYVGLWCNSISGFDLGEHITTKSGRHRCEGDIIINNPYCTAQPATVTAYTDAKYSFVDAVPAPTSVSGNVLTWDFSNIAANVPQQHIHFHLEVPGAWLTPGDTVNSEYTVTPSSGDINPVDNNCNTRDTVKSSYDPNEMFVVPSAYITSGTNLQYTIEFENTGNDTAFNIAVYDTLSDNLDERSLRMVAASAVMNIIPFKAGGHNIIKFDFPVINLLDSSHHNLCTGTVIFNINTKTGLPIGTTIFNHAGIFFDDNPVVMTDTVENIIGISIAGVAAAGNTSYVTIYPNPANDVLTIATANGIYSEAIITNLLGQEVIKRTLIEANGLTQTKVNVSMLPAGMYYVTIKGQDAVKVMKFEKL